LNYLNLVDIQNVKGLLLVLWKKGKINFSFRFI
jgi:hypothetical protein